MKKTYLIFLPLVLLICLLFLASCSGKSATPDDGKTYTISGTLTQFSTSGLKNKAIIDPSDYMLWLQNRYSHKVFFAELAADGSFSVDVQTVAQTLGDNFIAVLVKKSNALDDQVCDLEFVGTVVFNQSATSDQASTGIVISNNVSNLQIEYNPDLYKVLIDNTPSGVTEDTTIITRLDSTGKPVGADNVGKGTESKTSSTDPNNTGDEDKDGLPDIFDAMNDGAKLDNTEEATKYDSLAGSEKIDHATMFMSLKIGATAASTYTVTENASIVLEVVPKTNGTISSVVAYKLHSNFKDCIFDRLPDSFTSSTYPAEGTKWSDVGYQLYKVTDSESKERWTAIMWPKNNSFVPGNLVLLKVTYTDGTSEYFWVTINFKFKTIATNTNSWTMGGEGSKSNPYVIPNTGDLIMTWIAPKDEAGNDLTGLEYYFELRYYDTTTFPETLIATVMTLLGDDLYTGTIDASSIDLYRSGSISNVIQIDTVNSYPFGDNSSINICIKRQSW